jgi:hypothetical protein
MENNEPILDQVSTGIKTLVLSHNYGWKLLQSEDGDQFFLVPEDVSLRSKAIMGGFLTNEELMRVLMGYQALDPNNKRDFDRKGFELAANLLTSEGYPSTWHSIDSSPPTQQASKYKEYFVNRVRHYTNKSGETYLISLVRLIKAESLEEVEKIVGTNLDNQWEDVGESYKSCYVNKREWREWMNEFRYVDDVSNETLELSEWISKERSKNEH